MASNKHKKRKFEHPHLLIEEDFSSSESNHSDQDNEPCTNKKKTFWHPHLLIEEDFSSSASDHSDQNDESATNKKFSHPHLLCEVEFSSSDNNLSDEGDQFGGQSSPISMPTERSSSPIAGPSNLQIEARASSPIAGPSHQQIAPTPGPSGLQKIQPKPLTLDNSTWFEEETNVFENEDFALFIQKQDHQRQKVFRLDDHLFVMRIKLKNHKKPPLLSSIRDIIEQTMTVMVNDLKNYYNPEEQNLIYVTIKQPGNSCKHDCEIVKLKLNAFSKF